MYDCPRKHLLMVTMSATFGGCLTASFPASAQTTPATDKDATLPAISVQAPRKDRAGYQATATDAIAPGLTTKETPASVSVITGDFIKDTAASRIGDLVGYIPGVSVADNQGSPHDTISIRGFTFDSGLMGSSGSYYNGMRQAVTSSQYRSLDNIERVEIVKGPAGVEAGISDPGGFVNFISKKPQKTFALQGTLGVGDYGYSKVGVDVTGPIAAAPEFQYRLIASRNELASWRPGRDGRPQDLIAPSLNWDYAAGSRVTIEYEYYRTNDPLDRGGIYLRGAGFKNDITPRDWSAHQASDSLITKGQRFDIDWTHSLSSNLQSRVRFQQAQQHVERDAFRDAKTGGLYGPDKLTWNGTPTFPLTYTHDNNVLNSKTLDASLRGEFQTGQIEHTVVVGASRNESEDIFQSREANNQTWTTGNVVNVLRPDNNQAVQITGLQTYNAFQRGSDLNSAYGQWVARWLPQWRTVLSVRQDQFKSHFIRKHTNENISVENDLTSWRVATSYDLTSDVTAFVGYGNSFVPQNARDQNGKQLDPVRAQSYEAGIKTSLFGGRALWTNTIYQITQDNLSSTVDCGTNCEYSVLSGTVRMRGFESELVGQVTPVLQVSGGASYQDARYIKSAEGLTGKRYPNVPWTQFSAFASYRWSNLGLPALTTRLGVLQVGQREADSPNRYRLPAYTRFDGGVSYALSPKMSLDLAVENLFDRTYYPSAQDGGNNQIAMGNRRLAKLILRASW